MATTAATIITKLRKATSIRGKGAAEEGKGKGKGKRKQEGRPSDTPVYIAARGKKGC